MSDENGSTEEAHAGKRVTIISVLIIAAIVVTLILEIGFVEAKFWKPDMPEILAQYCGSDCSTEQFRQVMEQDAQLLRTERVRTTMMSRLMIFVVAEIVALMLISLGGVLIFNRIESTQNGNELSQGRMSLKSSFPGLIMCGLGAAVIVTSLSLATGPGLLITVYDYPVYTRDLNPMRNGAGFLSGQDRYHTPEERADQASSNIDDKIE